MVGELDPHGVVPRGVMLPRRMLTHQPRVQGRAIRVFIGNDDDVHAVEQRRNLVINRQLLDQLQRGSRARHFVRMVTRDDQVCRLHCRELRPGAHHRAVRLHNLYRRHRPPPERRAHLSHRHRVKSVEVCEQPRQIFPRHDLIHRHTACTGYDRHVARGSASASS